MLHLILGILIFVLTLGVIMVRPYRISEALAAVVGATLMLIGGYLLPGEALLVLKGQWNIWLLPGTDDHFSCCRQSWDF